MFDWLTSLFQNTPISDAGDIAAATSTLGDLSGSVPSGLGDTAGAIANAGDLAAAIPTVGDVSGLFSGGAQAAPAAWQGAGLAGANPATLGGIESVGQGAPVSGAFGDVDRAQMSGQNALLPAAVNTPYNSNAMPTMQPTPPTAWESIKNAPGRWWDAVSRDYMARPIANTAALGTLGLPLLAAALAPSAPKPGKYTLNPPMPVAPLPGTTGTSAADIPAATPMSPVLTGTGGFRVQKMAQGGGVNMAPGLAHGGPVHRATQPFVRPLIVSRGR